MKLDACCIKRLTSLLKSSHARFCNGLAVLLATPIVLHGKGKMFTMQLTRSAAMRVDSTLDIDQQLYLRGYAIAKFAPAGGVP